jgi:hypothetical protein
MKISLSQVFLREMPHLEVGEGVLDLRIERYPIPQEEKKKLFMAFKTTGFVGKLKDQPNQVAFISDKLGVKLATPEHVSELPHLPDDWETYSVSSSE